MKTVGGKSINVHRERFYENKTFAPRAGKLRTITARELADLRRRLLHNLVSGREEARPESREKNPEHAMSRRRATSEVAMTPRGIHNGGSVRVAPTIAVRVRPARYTHSELFKKPTPLVISIGECGGSPKIFLPPCLPTRSRFAASGEMAAGLSGNRGRQYRRDCSGTALLYSDATNY